jgi:hypothetical protein
VLLKLDNKQNSKSDEVNNGHKEVQDEKGVGGVEEEGGEGGMEEFRMDLEEGAVDAMPLRAWSSLMS